MARKSTSTTVAESSTAVGNPTDEPGTAHTAEKRGPTSAAELAAARRAAQSTTPAPHPPGAPPALVDGEPPVAVIASQATVSGFGSGGPARPVGGVWAGRPLVLETAPGAVGGVIPDDPIYVVADCDAQVHTIPPNCVTPVSRSLWFAGMRVRRDLYAAVMTEHAARAAAGTAGQPFPAALPPGVDGVPPDAVQPTPADGATAGATAGTTVVAPIVVPAAPGEPPV